MFDLRHLEHSTIIYEDPQHHPLLRLAWNKQDPNYLATMAMDAMEVTLHLNLENYISMPDGSGTEIGTGNRTGTIGDNEWVRFLSLSLTSVNISVQYIRIH